MSWPVNRGCTTRRTWAGAVCVWGGWGAPRCALPRPSRAQRLSTAHPAAAASWEMLLVSRG
jgi:hypothetical protein